MQGMATVLSVNVGRPRSIRVGDRTVRTAIGKAPALRRVRVGRTNLEGDRQADLRVHGGPNKAVYAYDISGYAHWEEELGRELPHGQFGENLTVEGMPETTVRIDDVYRIGSALLQVSQPRPPCFKLALHMGRPGFPAAFLASGRTGFYLRVLEEGDVGAGDAIALVERDPRSLSVLDTARRKWGLPPS
jgi:MOSC domain-containing protein YiiM